MSDLFDINAPANSIFLNELRRGEGVVVITSKAEKKVQGRVMIEARNPLVEEIVTIVDGERTFLPKEAQQFTIRVEMPPIMPGGTYQFRVQVLDVDSPDDTFQNGPEILFVAPHPAKFGAMAAAIAAVIILLVLLVGGIVGLIFLLNQVPEFPPFDSQLAFTTIIEGKERIYLYDLGDTEARVFDVTDASDETGLQYNNHAPAWSPEGRRLAFISDRQSNTWSIYIYNTTDEKIRRVDADIVDVVALAWSPDGERMVYLKRLNAQSYELIQIEANGDAPVSLYTSNYLLDSLAYYPDRRGLTFVENNQIQYLPFGGTVAPLMPIDYQAEAFGFPVEIAWSGGGDVLAVAAVREATNRREVSIYRINFVELSAKELAYQAESLVRLTFGQNDRLPFWSLDGRRILFVSSSRSNTSYLPQVQVILAEGESEASRLALPLDIAIFQPNLQPNVGEAIEPTATPTVTDTPTLTPSPTATATEVPQ